MPIVLGRGSTGGGGSGGAPTGPAGGDLGGTYPNPTVNNLASDKAKRTAGDVTTASTTFIDLTGMSVTIATGARRCLVVCNLNCRNTNAGNAVYYDLDIDGARQGGTDGLVDIFIPSNNFEEPAHFSYVTDVLTAASHTFKIQWRVSGNTGTTFASATAPAILAVVEMYAA